MPKYVVERSIEINATAGLAYEAVADFANWAIWSPWLVAEPDATVTVSDDSNSVGSTYHWSGTVVGAGKITHRRLKPGRLVEDDLCFLKPFKSRCCTVFNVESVGGGCRLTWRMTGSMPWFLFWMIPQIQVFIGMDFDRGLKMLKEWIETGSIQSQTTIHGVESVGPVRMAGVRVHCPMSEIGPAMQTAFATTIQKFKTAGLPTDAGVLTVCHRFDVKKQTFEMTAGFVIGDAVTELPDGLSEWSIGSGRALRVEHVGSYHHLGNAWAAANQNVRAGKLKHNRKAGDFEIYRNDPSTTPEAELRTDIFLPLK